MRKKEYKNITIITFAFSVSQLSIVLGSYGGSFLLFLLSLIIPNVIPSNRIINRKCFNLFVLIYCLCSLQAITYYFLGITEFQYVSRGISTSLYRIIEIYFCYKAINYFGIKIIDYLFIALCIAYGYNFIHAIIIYGIGPIISSMFSIFSFGFAEAGNETDKILEINHDILLIMPLFVIFYFIKDKNYKINNWKLMISLIISLLAYKRIAIGAMIIIAILYLLKSLYKKKLIFLYGGILITLLLFYVYLIYSGFLYLIMEKYDINLMTRDRFWNFIDNTYHFGISFIGDGWGFVSKYIHLYSERSLGYFVGGIHNDILKFYIDLGFIGFILYMAYFIIYIPIYLFNNYGKLVSFMFFLCQIYLIVLYTTDNSSIYICNQIVAFLIPFAFVLNINKNMKHIKLYRNGKQSAPIKRYNTCL